MHVRFDPFSPEWRDDPYPKYRELRDDAPVHYSEERGIYSVSRYDDVMAVLKQPEVLSSRAMFTVLLNNGPTFRFEVWSSTHLSHPCASGERGECARVDGAE